MQYCTACHKAIASITIMDLSEGQVSGQQQLCQECAVSMGAIAPKTQLKLSTEILEDLLGLKGGSREGKDRREGCPGCGMTTAEFKVKGRLGCPRCYETFRAELVPLLQRVHESSSHRGRLPTRSPGAEPQTPSPTADLRARLEDAVRGERYEEAARLRDQLRRIEKVPSDEADQGIAVTRKKKEPPEPGDFRAGEWLAARGPEADIAVCTRVRLARNLQGFHFSVAMSESEAKELNKFVTDRLTKPGLPEQLRVLPLEGLDDLERMALVERHLISREQAQSKKSRSVAVNEPESVAIMVNEEDHLRSQVFLSGLQPEAAWQRAEALDDALFQRLPMACSEEFGFLTSCPTNLGTGLRLSVMLHLPALVWAEEIEKATNTAQKIHLAVRGLYGEGSKALGDFYQVSNQVTLGRSEAQIVSDVQLAVSRIVQWERDVREALLRGGSRLRTLDRVHRALGTIERCQILTSEEALNCLSAIRFGIQQGILDGIAVADLNKALLLTQPAHLQRFTKERLDAAARDQKRASLLRTILGCEP